MPYIEGLCTNEKLLGSSGTTAGSYDDGKKLGVDLNGESKQLQYRVAKFMVTESRLTLFDEIIKTSFMVKPDGLCLLSLGSYHMLSQRQVTD